MMRRAVGLGSLTNMSWSIFAQSCLYALPGHRVISWWLGIPSESLSRTGRRRGNLPIDTVTDVSLSKSERKTEK